MSYTPGPWRKKGRRIECAVDGGLLAVVSERPFQAAGLFTTEQIADNARLIAAGPELVESLELAIGHWKGWVDQSTGLTPADILGFEADDYAKCSALLARIKGES